MSIRDAKAINRLARREIEARKRFKAAGAIGNHAALLLAAKHLTRIPMMLDRRAAGELARFVS